MNVVAIVQARMGSSRLPGKVLKPLYGTSVLGQVIDRLKAVDRINHIVIATTANSEDDVIVKEADRLGVSWSRGDQNDVLSRYYYAAVQYKADVVVRITSDCPLIDSEITNKVIESFFNMPTVDYCSNTLDRTFPRGLDTEVFTMEALDRCHREGKLDYEREHVTPYIYQHPEQFNIRQYTYEKDYSSYRWTLDTHEDWELISRMYNFLYVPGKISPWSAGIRLMEEHPELVEINKHIEQKKLGQ
jgi:spore coat polysaccharide biosynthesis protein SpsF